MALENVGLIWAFLAGVISFISPCVLPLIPGYISFITGLSVEELEQRETKSWNILMPAVIFVLGFSLVFVGLGATASIIGAFLSTYRLLLNRIAGSLIIVFGLAVMGIFKIPWLSGSRQWRLSRPLGNFGVLLVGMAFAFAWTPCVGQVLTSILLLASTTTTVQSGMLLLFVYSLGLGVPFIITGLALNKMVGMFGWIKNNYRFISSVSGLLLITMGALLATNQFAYFGTLLRSLPSPLNWLPSR